MIQFHSVQLDFYSINNEYNDSNSIDYVHFLYDFSNPFLLFQTKYYII